MQNSIVKKSLVIGIIFLLIGIGVLSNASSASISSSYKEILEYEIKPTDDQKEIITFIYEDDIFGYVGSSIIWRHPGVGFMIGWLEIDAYQDFTIKGFKKPILPLFKHKFEIKVEYVYAPLFIGQVFCGGPEHCRVRGIAFGNIYWE